MATGQNIVDEVRRTIHDTNVSTYRWSDAEMIDYINAGTRDIISLVPEAYTIETVTTISNNIARQTLPSGGVKFIRVSRNYADDGTTPQGAVTYCEKDVLDRLDPDWEYDTTLKADGANFFEHFCHDEKEKDVYYLYPPQAAANKKVAVVHTATPTAMSDLSETWPLPDEYKNGVVNYVLYRALTKEARETLPTSFRQELWNNYLASLGLQRQSESAAGPENPANRPPEQI